MLIPPSIKLVVMGSVVGVPITELFAAAVLPGILLAGLYTLYAVVRGPGVAPVAVVVGMVARTAGAHRSRERSGPLRTGVFGPRVPMGRI